MWTWIILGAIFVFIVVILNERKVARKRKMMREALRNIPMVVADTMYHIDEIRESDDNNISPPETHIS